MSFYKNIYDSYIGSLSKGFGQKQITEEEYNNILFIIRSAPSAPDGYTYMLRADNLEWELVENPPEPEPPVDDEVDDAEALSILLGGAE